MMSERKVAEAKEELMFNKRKMDLFFDKMIILRREGAIQNKVFIREMEWIYDNMRHDSDNV